MWTCLCCQAPRHSHNILILYRRSKISARVQTWTNIPSQCNSTANVLQPPTTAKRDQHHQGVDPPEAPLTLPHHASFPETAAELVLDLTVEGHNAASSSTAYTGFRDRPSMAGPDQVNILNLPLPDFDTLSGERCAAWCVDTWVPSLAGSIVIRPFLHGFACLTVALIHLL